MVRTFAAVPVDDPGVVAALAAAQDRLRAAGGRVRWVAPAQFHFTLKFLGEIPAGQVGAAAAALAQAARQVAPFTLQVAGLGAFPRPEAARVIWAGIGSGAAELAALAARTEEAMAAAGFPPAERPFQPHLTLGRVAEGGLTAALVRAVAGAPGVAFGRVQVTRAVLYRSDLGPAGPRYTPLAVCPLGG